MVLPIITEPPPAGVPINQNDVHTFNIPVYGGSQADMDGHQDALLMTKVDSVYDAYGPSPAEVDMKFLYS